MSQLFFGVATRNDTKLFKIRELRNVIAKAVKQSPFFPGYQCKNNYLALLTLSYQKTAP
jgi:hypothetical protein